MHTLDGGRIGIAAQALGLAEGALRENSRLRKREKAVRPQQSVSSRTHSSSLADMATKVKAAQLMVYRAAAMKDEYQAGARSFLRL